MEATMFNQIKPYMMYVFEPLRTWTMHFVTNHGHSWTLVASNGLKFLKKIVFSNIGWRFSQFLLKHWICTMNLLTYHGHSWTLLACNGLKFLKNRFFQVWGDFFSILLQRCIRYALGTSKRGIVRVVHLRPGWPSWRPQYLIKLNPTWCIVLSLSDHVQCIC